MNFMQTLHHKKLLFDGGFGTQLAERGLLDGCPELCNVDHPDDVRAIHAAYIEAGADVITANTFGGSSIKLEKYDLAPRAQELCKAGVSRAREAIESSGKPAFLAASIGPTGELLPPMGSTEPEQLYKSFYDQAKACAEAGADLLLVETMSDMQEARLAILAARAACDLPLGVSFTFNENGFTLMGNPPSVCATLAQALGCCLLGINCGGGPQQLLPSFEKLIAESSLPVLAMPNAGLPLVEDGRLHYPYSPEMQQDAMKEYLQKGAWCIGGCCGTTPAHIALLRGLLDANQSASFNALQRPAMLCSARNAVPADAPFAQAAFPVDADELTDEAMDCEADWLLLDLHGADAKQVDAVLTEALPGVHLPLGFTCQSPDVLSAALWRYPGVAAVRTDNPACKQAALKFGAWII